MRFAILTGVLVLLPTMALADDDAWLGNNTIVIGGQMHIAFKDDHSFTMKSGATDVGKGTWTYDGGKVCLTADPPQGAPDCKTMEAHAVGDKWTLDGAEATLVAGTE